MQWSDGDQWNSNPGWDNAEDGQDSTAQSIGQWMYNPGWAGDNLYLKGRILVQGFWEWGVVLSWHVQRNVFTAPGSLGWVCVLWRKNANGAWIVQLEQMKFIPSSQEYKIKEWMIHDPGDMHI